MNTKNNIDQLFAPLRETTKEAPMHLWPEIEAAIAPEPKKKKRFLWFGLFGFLLLACSSLIIFAQSNQTSKGSGIKPVEKMVILKQVATNSSNQPQKTKQQTTTKGTQTVVKSSDSNFKKTKTTALKLSPVPILEPQKTEQHPIVQNNTTASAPIKQVHHPLATRSILRKSERNSHITPPISLEMAQLPQIEIDLPNNHFILAKPEEKCAGSRVIKVPKSIFIDAYVSPVFSNTFFVAKTTEASSYAKLRDSTEGDKVGLLLGARVGYIHESGINVRAGIAYQQIRTKFQYNVEQDEKMIIQIFRDDNGNIIGRDTTYEFGRRHLNVTNQYSTVDLPISLGYISMKNKVQIGLHIGAALNLNFRQSGTYLNQQSLVTKFSDKKIFAKSIGASFFGSVELQYLLADQWGIFIEPQVRFYPQSLTSKGHPIKQNVTNFNVLTGIKYIF